LARRKARQVANRLLHGVVLAADTLIDLDGCLLGKPRSPREASAMLHALRGKQHNVVTGLAVQRVGETQCRSSVLSTRVTVSEVSSAVIESYVATGEPLDKAGAYAIQGIGGGFIRKIEGCFNNVVGLPLCLTAWLLSQYPVSINAEAELCRLPDGTTCPANKLRTPRRDACERQ
jgi:MAF protein